MARAAIPHSAVVLGPLEASTAVHLSLTLAPSDPGALAAEVAAVSEPGAADYHHFLTTSQFRVRFGASRATVTQVRQELSTAGISSSTLAADGLSLSFTTTAATASRAFHTHLATTLLATGRLAFANTTAASLPTGATGLMGLQNVVEAHAQDVTASPSYQAPNPCSAGNSSIVNSPAAVASAYNISGLYSAGADGTGTSVALFELGQYSGSDLQTYASCFGLSTAGVSKFTVDSGPPTDGSGTTETTADIENVMTYAPRAAIQVYEGPNNEQGLYDTYAAIVNANKAQVISTSWGICEAQNDPVLMSSENTLFQQAAVQGQTIIAATGDSGSEDCYSAPTSLDTSLQVDDPASQPYVTGAGGTSLSSTSPRTESVWNSALTSGSLGAAGGGISSVWPMPSWQRSAVNGASSNGPCRASSGYCRQVPDVSASADPAHGYAVYCTSGDCSGRGWGSVGGTSMASPLWASIVALSDQSCATSKRAGFINPTLYGSGASGMNDIVSGENDMLGVHGGAYTARVGYDMASGMGSPNAAALAPSLCAAAGNASATTTTSTTTTSTTTTSTTSTTAPTTTTAPAPPTTVPAPSGGGGPPPISTPVGHGYRFVAADGGIFDYGSAGFLGSGANRGLTAPVFSMAATAAGAGYWLAAANGQVLAFGAATDFGSVAASQLHAPIVAMAATADGAGYWLAAADGNVYAFGDAVYHGSAAGLHLSAPIVGMAADPVTGGYWLVGGDGGIFSFAAPFFGSTGNLRLVKPIVGMTGTPDGLGYRFVASDGGVFDYGTAAFYGSAGNLRLAKPIVGMATTADGGGYWLVGSDGGIFTYGDAPFLGSTGAIRLAQPVVGMTGF